MIEIVRINIENEMDLILAHKRSMKLAELCGLSVIIQTSFATAVSEISRCVISKHENKSYLILGINSLNNNRKELVAKLSTTVEIEKDFDSSLKYANRLIDSLKVSRERNLTNVSITQKINFSGLLNETRVKAFVTYFQKELPLSPYDEIRKKNIHILEVSEKLKESEDQYRRLSETLPLMVFTTNAMGDLTYGNQWLKDYFNLTDIIPGRVKWLSFVNPRDHKKVYSDWEKTQLSSASFKSEARLGTGAEPLWHLISLTPLKNDANQLIGWTGFFVDIHAQKLVEETLKSNVELNNAQKQLLSYQAKLEENVKELNKSNHDLEQFAYIASHDLQEPLRKIMNFTDLLDQNIDNKEKATKYLGKIDEASLRMSTLIKDVLNYSRLSRSEANFEETDLHQILTEVKTDLELTIEEKKAVIKSSRLPVISCVPQQIHQLFYNLVSNALKFNTGQPQISVDCRELSKTDILNNTNLHAGTKYISLSLKDNGIGFDQKYAEQVFTIFKRLNSRETFSGTGIGLALCKKIVDNHHGNIKATSEPGVGTTFTIILPVS